MFPEIDMFEDVYVRPGEELGAQLHVSICDSYYSYMYESFKYYLYFVIKHYMFFLYYYRLLWWKRALLFS